MTDEELVARLHLPWPKDESVDEVTLPLWVLELTAEAADRIEAQASEIERLRGDLAKAVEAFGCWNRMMNNQAYDIGEMVSEFDAIARTTLAELTGAKDE